MKIRGAWLATLGLLALRDTGQAETIILRQNTEILIDGVGQGSNYTGTEDVTLGSGLPGTNFDGPADLEVDTSTASHVLLKFGDPFSNIPAFSTITSATLFIDIDNIGNDMALHRLNATASWDETTATWNNFGGSLNDGVSTANDSTGNFTTIGGLGDKVTVDVTADVVAWHSGATNNGWAFLPGGSNGVDFDSSENGNPADRPALTITYITPQELMLIQDENVTIDAVSQGIVYTGTHDAELRQDAPDLTHNAGTGSTNGEFSVDANSQAVIRFDDLFDPLPADAVITRARLFIDIDSTGDDLSLYCLTGALPWDESTATWNNFGSSPNDGVLVGTETTATSRTIDGQGNKMFIDVTDDVLAWKSGTPNEGWGFLPSGPDGVEFDSSENSEAVDRPALLLTFTSASSQPNLLTRGPYLQSGGTDRVTICWRTTRFSNSVVRYGTDLENLDQTVAVAGSRLDHEVLVTGLTPNTRYYYVVESQPAIGPKATITAAADTFFDTSPPAGSLEKTTLWVIGDSGTANANADAVYDGFRGFFTGGDIPHADVWLMLGDNAYNSGTDAEYQAAVFETYPELLRNSVLWSTLGNHDAYALGQLAYLDIFSHPTAGESGGVASGTERYYSFDYANIHFICLDSESLENFTDEPGGGGMYDWLESDLQACDQDWIIAYFHHGPYTMGSHNSDTEPHHISMRRHLIPLLESYGVDLVLSGHSHQYERSRFITGHHGLISGSSTFSAANVIDGGNGSLIGEVDPLGAWIADPQLGDGPYRKPLATADDGTVYSIVGASGKISSWDNNSSALVNPAPHPAHLVNLRLLGSMFIEVDGFTLNAKYIDSNGNIRDDFSISKSSEFHLTATPDKLTEAGGPATVTVIRDSEHDFEDHLSVTSTHPEIAPQLPTGIPFGPTELSMDFPLSLAADDKVEGAVISTISLAPSRAVQPGAALRRALLPGSTSSLALTLNDSPSQQWYFDQFGATTLTRNDWLADTDGDGLSLGFEALLGGSEGADDRALLPSMVRLPAAIELHFQRDTAITDLTPLGQHSKTMAENPWLTDGLGLERVGPANPGGIELWKVSMPYPFETDDRHFLRLAIQELLTP